MPDDNLLAVVQEEKPEQSKQLEEDTKNKKSEKSDDYDSPFDFAQGTRGKSPLITI